MAHDEFRFGRRGNAVGLLVTLALHGGVLAAVGLASARPAPPLIVERNFVSAELVKLGKPRDKFWLPRITQPPPRPKAPPEVVKVTEDPNAQAAPKEAPRPEDPKISKDLKRALDRARKLQALATPEEPEEEEVGSESGSRIGTASQAVGDPYFAEVNSYLHQNYSLPAGIAPEQIAKRPEIQFHIGRDGVLSDVKLSKSSGNSFVDDACVQAALLTRKVPPPPANVHGIRVECE